MTTSRICIIAIDPSVYNVVGLCTSDFLRSEDILKDAVILHVSPSRWDIIIPPLEFFSLDEISQADIEKLVTMFEQFKLYKDVNNG